MCEWVPGERSPDRCLAAGTLVDTLEGQIPIEKIKVGMHTMTRQGYRRVTAAGMTAEDASLIIILFSNGVALTGTPDHYIHTAGRGFIPMDALVWNDTVWIRRPSSTEDRPTQDTPPPRIRRGQGTFIQSERPSINKYGSMQTAQSRSGIKSITLMETPQIMHLPILNVSPERNTTTSTTKANVATGDASIYRTFDQLQRNGTPPQKGTNGINNMERNPGRDGGQDIIKPVKNAGHHSLHSWREQPSARENASIEMQRENERTLNSGRVPFAAANSKSRDQGNSKPAPVYVVQKCAAGTGPVFNLSIEDAHEFYANGILVHNCDALVWAMTELAEKGVSTGIKSKYAVPKRSGAGTIPGMT